MTSVSNKSNINTTNTLIWVHCNLCFELYINKRKKILFLSCLHVLCETCLNSVSKKPGQKFCPFCKKDIKYKIINNELPSNCKRYFHPKPWINVENIKDVIPFQIKQHDHYARGLRKFQQNANNVKQEVIDKKKKIDKINNLIEQKKKGYQILESELKRLQDENDSGIGSFEI